MLSSAKLNSARKRWIFVSLLTACLAVMLVLPQGRLPDVTPTAEAGCFMDGPTLDQMVEDVFACPNSNGGVDVTFEPRNDFFLTGSCGDAHVEFLNTDNGTGFTSSTFAIHLDPANPSSATTFGFRIVGYPSAGGWNGSARKVHTTLQVPSDLSSCRFIFVQP